VRKDTIPIEYSEESINNLFVLIKALGELLLDRGWIDEVTLQKIMQVNFARQLNQVHLSIPMFCTACGRNGFSRPGENSSCLYCGRELRFNMKDEQADEILASLDAAKLFGFTVKAADITYEDTFISTAAKIFTAPCTYIQSDDNGYRLIEMEPDKVSENSKIIEAQNKVAAHQKQISRFCQIMLSMWELVSARNTEAGSMILKEFLTIDESKKQHAYKALYAPSICEKCHTEQWPSQLFHAACSACGEPLPARLLPGLPVMQKKDADAPSQYTPKERKLEYLYTLFEALFHCVGAACGITLDDLANEINEKIIPPGNEEIEFVCPLCLHSSVNSLIIHGRCPHCGQVSAGVF